MEALDMGRIRGFEVVKAEHRKNEGVEIQLPTRGSEDSAGYDFYAPHDVVIPANDKALIWTDVKAYMQDGEMLIALVRSSIGIKLGLMFANTVGIIDADYYENPSNDGNIGICLRNLTDKDISISKGERIAQGIFQSFLVADNGNTKKERVGGIGSTGN